MILVWMKESIGFGIVCGLIVHQLYNPRMLFDATQRQTS